MKGGGIMNLIINGKPESVELQKCSIKELLSYKKVEMPEMVSVEYNGRFLKQTEYETIRVKENDQIEFLYFMGGGAR
jgi:sulfur carrier protein